MPDRHHSASRERLCWAIAAGFVAATWSTLYWARLAADWFRGHGWLTPLMWLIFASAAGAVLAAVLRLAPGWRELAVLAAFGIVYALTIGSLRMLPEEALHFVQYGTIGGFFYAALGERRRRGGPFLARPAVPAVLAFLLTAAAGWTDEGIQYLLPNRVYDLRDVGFNAAAAALAIAGTASWRWAHERGAGRVSEPPGPEYGSGSSQQNP